MKTSKVLTNKNIILVVAFNGFQDREYEVTRKILEGGGAKILVASSVLGRARGKSDSAVDVDLLLDDIKIQDVDALVFIGGPGASEYFDSQKAHSLAQEAVAKEKVLGAICIAPEILAKAGVLKDKKATVWSSVVDRSPIKVLQASGVEYVDQKVVRDGKIITANGPAAAKEFGKTIVDVLSE